MQSFTHLAVLEHLNVRDFTLFYSSFREVVEQKFVQFNDLIFLHNGADFEDYSLPDKVAKKVKHFFNDTNRIADFFSCEDQSILISFPAREQNVIAVITDVDPYFASHVSKDWLEEFRQSVTESFLLIKRAGIDLETGVLNNQQFYSTLRRVSEQSVPVVALLEVYPRARSSRESEIHKAKVARSLKSCLDSDVSLFYLGHHVFAVLANEKKKNTNHGLGRKLLSWLRREGFRKVHIGTSWQNTDFTEQQGYNHIAILEQAQFALQTARRRGPFALCNYDHIRHPEHHPLRKPSQRIMAKFRRRWQKIEAFSIVQFQANGFEAGECALAGMRHENLISDGENTYAFLPETSPEEALEWGKELITTLRVGEVQMGVACYPQNGFSKGQVVFNCRKALQHAAFFGANGSAVFDGVSLNISGDIYYAEGDLNSAVREYKSGLLCDPGNINLLNSLGVSYADMDKHKEAWQCFEEALTLDPANFMALYNAGLGAESSGKNIDAVTCYEKAVRLESEFEEVKDELVFRLGRQYCIIGRYCMTIEFMLPWYEKNIENPSRDRALSILGKAYYELGRYRQAIQWLQRALIYNEYDAESMGLLGHAYLLQKEGDDIALSLCEKSVDIEPDNHLLKIPLAKVQIACKLHAAARETLRRCLRNKKTSEEAKLLSCLNYKEEGKKSRARFWFKRLMNDQNLDAKIASQLEVLKEELNEI